MPRIDAFDSYEEDTMDCPICGEVILTKSSECPECGEIFEDVSDDSEFDDNESVEVDDEMLEDISPNYKDNEENDDYE